MATILETLIEADHNIQSNGSPGVWVARKQLHNAVVLLEKGHQLEEEVEFLLEKYGTVEEGPNP